MGQVRRLCRRAKAGDRRAAAELLGLSYEKVFNYLRRLCGSAADAEDLTQETFAKVWSALGDFRGQSAFSSWVHKVAYHVYVDWRRREEPVVPQTNAWWQERVDHNPSPFKRAEDKQLAEQLYGLVDRLSENEKQIVHLRFYQGLSLRDAAYVLDEAPFAK
ncbi:MAG: RNA polymerase sigma factor [Planctomycetota bacterium]